MPGGKEPSQSPKTRSSQTVDVIIGFLVAIATNTLFGSAAVTDPSPLRPQPAQTAAELLVPFRTAPKSTINNSRPRGEFGGRDS